MSASHDAAVESMKALLWELPMEFSIDNGMDPDSTEPRHEFRVIKQSNVRKVHRALWELQQYLGMEE